VWSNAGGNRDRDYRDQGWFCPPDGRTTKCTDHVIHFDVALPSGFGRDDVVLSPVDGYVDDIYDTGEGKSIHIVPVPAFTGVQELLANRTRIETLAKGVFAFNYGITDVSRVSLHIAHVVPLVKEKDRVKKGQPIAKVFLDAPWNPKKIAYVIYIHMKDGNYYQFGLCDVPNQDEFCGKCYPGSPYPCP
jgi:hypothetical protein